MKAIQFRLGGKTAFFKQPDVNTYGYFTYGQMHRVALLGILGAIMGYGGYNQQRKDKKHPRNEEAYPEFYEKLTQMKTAITPLNEKGYIPKKMQVFNNSVGYASQEEGGNLIVQEQWLEDPSWLISILIETDQDEILAKRLINKKFVYVPYLGKNDHFATIDAIHEIQAEPLDQPGEKHIKINSLFPGKACKKICKPGIMNRHQEPFWKYEEQLPIALEKNCNQYIKQSLMFTNFPIEGTFSSIYQMDYQYYYFIGDNDEVG